jgi:uncharacterized protein (DUF433 family)
VVLGRKSEGGRGREQWGFHLQEEAEQLIFGQPKRRLRNVASYAPKITSNPDSTLLSSVMTRNDSNVVISAFTQEQVGRLTGISVAQLSYWDRTRFFEPSFAAENRRSAYSRIYSFHDVVCLQVLKTLRNDLGVSLPHLREVKARLSHLGHDAWTETTLYVVKKRVVFDDPESGKPREVVSGQYVLEIPLKIVSENMQSAVKKLWRRDPRNIGKISQNRRIAHNSRVVAGTRIPVKSIKEFSDAGYSIAEIIAEYPSLTEGDIAAALRCSRAA